MTNYQFDTTAMTGEIIDRLDETYQLLRSKFGAEPTGDIDFKLGDFETLRTYQNVNVCGSFVVKNPKNSSYIIFTECNCGRTSTDRWSQAHDVFEYQVWGLAYLKQNFGRVVIRRETLADKLIELVMPVEIDFAEDKAFSDTFYVLANDFQKASMAINRNFRNAVMDIRHEDFIIEIYDHTLIIGSKKPVSPERSIYIAEFVARISTMC